MEYLLCHNQRKMRFFLPLGIFIALMTAGTQGLAEDALKEQQDASATIDFANGLYSRKMYAPAVNEYQKFIRLSPDSPDAASAYFRLADSYFFLKEYPKAIEAFETFHSKFPTDVRGPIALFR